MCDIDHFKRFNDTYGHETGDQVLRLVAAKLAGVTGGARAYRVGGEEFSILFPGKSVKDALPHLELLRSVIEASRFHVRGGQERRGPSENQQPGSQSGRSKDRRSQGGLVADGRSQDGRSQDGRGQDARSPDGRSRANRAQDFPARESPRERRSAERRAEARRTPASRRRSTRIGLNPAANHPLSVTVSIGVSEPDTKARAPEQVIQAADKALYRAKESGRNRVEFGIATRPAKPKRNIA